MGFFDPFLDLPDATKLSIFMLFLVLIVAFRPSNRPTIEETIRELAAANETILQASRQNLKNDFVEAQKNAQKAGDAALLARRERDYGRMGRDIIELQKEVEQAKDQPDLDKEAMVAEVVLIVTRNVTKGFETRIGDLEVDLQKVGDDTARISSRHTDLAEQSRKQRLSIERLQNEELTQRNQITTQPTHAIATSQFTDQQTIDLKAMLQQHTDKSFLQVETTIPAAALTQTHVDALINLSTETIIEQTDFDESMTNFLQNEATIAAAEFTSEHVKALIELTTKSILTKADVDASVENYPFDTKKSDHFQAAVVDIVEESELATDAGVRETISNETEVLEKKYNEQFATLEKKLIDSACNCNSRTTTVVNSKDPIAQAQTTKDIKALRAQILGIKDASEEKFHHLEISLKTQSVPEVPMVDFVDLTTQADADMSGTSHIPIATDDEDMNDGSEHQSPQFDTNMGDEPAHETIPPHQQNDTQGHFGDEEMDEVSEPSNTSIMSEDSASVFEPEAPDVYHRPNQTDGQHFPGSYGHGNETIRRSPSPLPYHYPDPTIGHELPGPYGYGNETIRSSPSPLPFLYPDPTIAQENQGPYLNPGPTTSQEFTGTYPHQDQTDFQEWAPGDTQHTGFGFDPNGLFHYPQQTQATESEGVFENSNTNANTCPGTRPVSPPFNVFGSKKPRPGPEKPPVYPSPTNVYGSGPVSPTPGYGTGALDTQYRLSNQIQFPDGIRAPGFHANEINPILTNPDNDSFGGLDAIRDWNEEHSWVGGRTSYGDSHTEISDERYPGFDVPLDTDSPPPSDRDDSDQSDAPDRGNTPRPDDYDTDTEVAKRFDARFEPNCPGGDLEYLDPDWEFEKIPGTLGRWIPVDDPEVIGVKRTRKEKSGQHEGLSSDSEPETNPEIRADDGTLRKRPIKPLPPRRKLLGNCPQPLDMIKDDDDLLSAIGDNQTWT